MDILLGNILIQRNVVTKEGCKYLADYVKIHPKIEWVFMMPKIK